MRCKKCNARLAVHDIWCVECGTQSPVVKTELSALASLRKTYSAIKGRHSEFVPAAGLAIILGALPLAAGLFILSFVISLEITSDLSYLMNMLIKALVAVVFLPFIFLPFYQLEDNQDYSLKLIPLKDFPKAYGRYFAFSLLNVIFFLIIHLICFGLPAFASDPILRLVWIVLVNYWFAIALPAPALMQIKGLRPCVALLKSYRHLGDLRWNIYLLALVLTLLNFIAFTLFIFPLLFTLPISYFAIRDYTQKLIEYELMDYRIK